MKPRLLKIAQICHVKSVCDIGTKHVLVRRTSAKTLETRLIFQTMREIAGQIECRGHMETYIGNVVFAIGLMLYVCKRNNDVAPRVRQVQLNR